MELASFEPTSVPVAWGHRVLLCSAHRPHICGNGCCEVTGRLPWARSHTSPELHCFQVTSSWSLFLEPVLFRNSPWGVPPGRTPRACWAQAFARTLPADWTNDADVTHAASGFSSLRLAQTWPVTLPLLCPDHLEERRTRPGAAEAAASSPWADLRSLCGPRAGSVHPVVCACVPDPRAALPPPP